MEGVKNRYWSNFLTNKILTNTNAIVRQFQLYAGFISKTIEQNSEQITKYQITLTISTGKNNEWKRETSYSFDNPRASSQNEITNTFKITRNWAWAANTKTGTASPF